ncbi:MAG: sulfatase family protein [Verrucomicrobiales bacterium]
MLIPPDSLYSQVRREMSEAASWSPSPDTFLRLIARTPPLSQNYNMIRVPSILVVACLLIQLASAKPPNIVLFLADDLGFGDLGSYGNPIIQTPHLDTLAKDGVRLTDCHSGGTVCSPSRSSLITGRTPYRVGFYTIAGAEGCHLREQEVTLPNLLKEKGYDTCFVGKWHMGKITSEDAGPKAHGYDHWFATEHNAFDDPEAPGKFLRNGEPVGKLQGSYCDLIVEEAVNWMKNRPDPEKPFLLVVCSHEPHTPIKPPAEYSAMYDNIRTEMLESTIGYGQVTRPRKRDISENMKYYYGTVTQLDDAFGRLMDSIDEQGKREESLVVFTSDNGPETPVTFEESHDQWEDPIRDRCFGSPGPWRGMKRYAYEGGHRVPGIVRWPGKIEAGTLSTELVNGTDWMPTVCAAVGVEIPEHVTIDGVDALAALQGKPVAREIPACWMFPVGYDYRYLASMSMRDGDHTLIGFFSPKLGDQGNSAWVKSASLESFALYDLSIDPAQRNDLKAHRPEEFERLKKLMVSTWKNIQAEAPDWTKQ